MVLNERYEYNPQQDRLGKGGFGTVYKAKDLIEHKTVALKFVQKSKLPERYSLYNEILRIRALDHPNLVKYYDALIKEYENVAGEQDEMHIGIMEYINGGDLGAFMKMPISKNPYRIRLIIRGILEGIDYLHQHKIVHRDIKPQNILLQIDEHQIIPKIADFSISKEINNELTSVSATVGTYEYMSPEQLGKTDAKLGFSTDIWSFGVLAYQLLLGELPFGSRRKGNSDGQIIANILNPDWTVDVNSLEEPYAEIIQKCLQKNPLDRFQNIAEILTYFPKEDSLEEEDTAVIKEQIDNNHQEENKTENTVYFDEPELNTKTNISNIALDKTQENLQEDFQLTNPTEKHTPGYNFTQKEVHAQKPNYQLTQTIHPYQNNGTNQKLNVEPENHSSRWALSTILIILFAFGVYLLIDWMNTQSPLDRTTVEKNTLPNAENSEDPEVLGKNPESAELNTQPMDHPEEKEESLPTDLEDAESTSEPDIWKVEVEIKEKDKPQVVRTNEEKDNNSTPQNTTNTGQPPPKEQKNVTYTASRKYDYVEEYPNGSIVSLDGKYGYLDTYGNIKIPLKYDDFVNFQEGLAAVKRGTQWGYINKRNEVVIPFRYERPGVFNGGMALVTHNGKDIYINKKGKCVRDCE